MSALGNFVQILKYFICGKWPNLNPSDIIIEYITEQHKKDKNIYDVDSLSYKNSDVIIDVTKFSVSCSFS